MEHYANGAPVLVTGYGRFNWETQVFEAGRGHAFTVGRAGGFGSVQSAVSGNYFNTINEISNTALQTYISEPVMPFSIVYREYEILAVGPAL